MSFFRLKILVLLYLLFDSCHFAGAQVINSRTITDTPIVTRYISLLKTETLVPIDSVLTRNSQKSFKKLPNQPVIFPGYNQFYYWFRIPIKNEDSLPKDLMLIMPPVGMRDGRLFQREGNTWNVIGVTGYKYPFLERTYQYAHYVFPLTIQPRTLDTLYLSMDASHAFKSYGFALKEPKKLKAFENRVYLEFGIIVGLLILFCLFNFYLYFTLKDKIHLWYTLYIVMLILLVMKNDQLDQEFLGWDSEKVYIMTSIMGIGAVAFAILVHVVQQFLVDIKKDAFLYRLTLFVKWNVFISGIAQLVIFYFRPEHQIQTWVFHWSQKSTILTSVVIIINCIYSIVKGNKTAYFILGGLLVFLVGSIQRLLLIGTSSYFFPPHLLHLGMVMEAFIISFGLIYRYRLDRNEKFRYLKEREHLKNSRDKLLLESKIEIQEQTLKATFKEINNNIGQDINSVKENLLHLKTTHPEGAEKYLSDSRKLLSKAIGELRNLCKTLDTDYVRDMGLLKSIEYELEQCRKSGACNTTLKINGEQYRFDPKKELILFRIYQEVLNNINRFVSGNSILVVLNYEPAFFELMISYNGKRFDIKSIEETKSEVGAGVLNLHNRADLIGASFTIGSKSKTTHVTIRLPMLMPAVAPS